MKGVICTSFVSTQAKLIAKSKKYSNATNIIRKDYTNFAGTTVPILTKKQWDKGMALSNKYKNLSMW